MTDPGLNYLDGLVSQDEIYTTFQLHLLKQEIPGQNTVGCIASIKTKNEITIHNALFPSTAIFHY